MKKYFPGISWAVLIFILSSISTNSIILPGFWRLFSMDKAAHALFYFILYYLWAKSFTDAGISKKRSYLILLLLCIAYGGLLELYQGYFLTYREVDWLDEVANSIGVITGYFYHEKKTKIRYQ